MKASTPALDTHHYAAPSRKVAAKVTVSGGEVCINNTLEVYDHTSAKWLLAKLTRVISAQCISCVMVETKAVACKALRDCRVVNPLTTTGTGTLTAVATDVLTVCKRIRLVAPAESPLQVTGNISSFSSVVLQHGTDEYALKIPFVLHQGAVAAFIMCVYKCKRDQSWHFHGFPVKQGEVQCSYDLVNEKRIALTLTKQNTQKVCFTPVLFGSNEHTALYVEKGREDFHCATMAASARKEGKKQLVKAEIDKECVIEKGVVTVPAPPVTMQVESSAEFEEVHKPGFGATNTRCKRRKLDTVQKTAIATHACDSYQQFLGQLHNQGELALKALQMTFQTFGENANQ